MLRVLANGDGATFGEVEYPSLRAASDAVSARVRAVRACNGPDSPRLLIAIDPEAPYAKVAEAMYQAPLSGADPAILVASRNGRAPTVDCDVEAWELAYRGGRIAHERIASSSGAKSPVPPDEPARRVRATFVLVPGKVSWRSVLEAAAPALASGSLILAAPLDETPAAADISSPEVSFQTERVVLGEHPTVMLLPWLPGTYDGPCARPSAILQILGGSGEDVPAAAGAQGVSNEERKAPGRRPPDN